MKKIFPYLTIALLALGLSASAGAQNRDDEQYELVDTVVYRMAATADSTLTGKSIFSLMPSRAKGDAAEVVINQSEAIATAMSGHIRSNSTRTIKGYRVRIYFDNKQVSRNASMGVYNSFRSRWHDIPAYRSYVNPYFKVTVGDFRTKSEAMRFLEEIRGAFPSAFVVKENIQYPVVDKANAAIADTIKIRRKIEKPTL